MSRVEHQHRPDLVGDRTHTPDRVMAQVEAPTDRDDRRSDPVGKMSQSVEVDRAPIGVDGCLVDLEPAQTGGTRPAMGDVSGDGGGWRDDRITGPGAGHERIQVRHRTRPDPDLDEGGGEHLGCQLGGDDLDLLDRVETGLVLVAGMTERGSRTQTGRQQRLGTRVHHVRRRVEVQALVIVDASVGGDQFVQAPVDRTEILRPDRGGHLSGRGPDQLRGVSPVMAGA